MIRQQNFKKKPHTARFLMAFHTAAYGLASDIAEAKPTEDLLAAVPVEHVADHRSEGQTRFMESLIAEVTMLDATAGEQARTYTDGMTEHGLWTPGREGKAAGWITRLIAKRDALKAAARQVATPVQVADGRYAVEEGGTLKFFKVKNGRNAGFVFLDIQASAEWYPVRNVTRIREVLALIAVDAKAAMVRYGQELGECGHCGRILTDEASRAAGIGPVCASK